MEAEKQAVENARFAREKAARDAEKDMRKRETAAAMTLPKLHVLPTGPCRFVRIISAWDGVKPVVCTVARRGASICYRYDPFPAKADAGLGKFRLFDKAIRARVVADIAAGFVFALPAPTALQRHRPGSGGLPEPAVRISC